MNISQGTKLKQADRRIAELSSVKSAMVTRNGWIRWVRKILGMSSTKLAEKLGVSQPTLSSLEKREGTKQITLRKLEEVANALECDLVYAFVPRSSFEQKINEQATKKARELLARANEHMELEDQKVTGRLDERLESLKAHLIKSGKIW